MRALIAGGRLRRVTWTYHATADVLTVTWPHEYPGGPGHLPLHGACYERGSY